MRREDTLSGVREVFREIFDDEDMIVEIHTVPDDIEDWDSVEQINLVAGLESHFHVRFSAKEIAQMTSVSNMVKILEEHESRQ